MTRSIFTRVDARKESIFKVLALLSFPILICGACQQLYTLVELALIGKQIEGFGLAITGGTAGTLISLFQNMETGIITGCMVIVANAYGAQNDRLVHKGIEQSFLLSGLFALLFSLLFLVFAKPFLTWFRVPEALIGSSASYLRLYALGFIPYGLFQMGINLLRSLGELKKPTLYLIFSFLTNIVLDFVFIVFLHADTSGIALAFITTQIISCIWLFLEYKKNAGISVTHIKWHAKEASKMLTIGVPSSITSMFYAITNLLIQMAINLLGHEAISGFAINGRIENFFWITMTGIGFAVTTCTSQNFGAKSFSRVKETLKKGLLLALGITVVISCIVYFLRFPLASLFSTEFSTIKIATSIMAFMAPIYFIYTPIEVFSGILKGVGKAIIPSYITLGCICGIRGTLIYAFALKAHTISSILWVYPISWVITACFYLLYYSYVKRSILHERNLSDIGTVDR